MGNIPFLILFLIIIAFLFRVDFIFYIIYVLFGVYALNRWLIPRSLRCLRISRQFSSHAFIGDLVSVQIRITNKSRIPIPWLHIRESVPVVLRRGSRINRVTSVSGREGRRFTYQVQATKRGYYRLGPLSIAVGDHFGFTNVESQKDPSYITIYPQIIPLRKLGLSSNLPFGAIASKQRLFEDPARPIGVRDYKFGDTPRTINWKVSAKQRKLLVRIHQPAISLETFILLNLNKDEYSRRHRYDSSEWGITVAASLAAHLVEQRQAVGLGVNGLDPLLQVRSSEDLEELFDEESGRLEIPADIENIHLTSTAARFNRHQLPDPVSPHRSRLHLMKVLEVLARVESGSALPFTQYILESSVSLGWGTTLLVISPHGSEEICYAIHRLVRKGFNPVLVIIEPYADIRSVRLRGRSLGFQVFQISSLREIDIWRRSPELITMMNR